MQSYIIDNHGNQGHTHCGDWFNLLQGLRFTANGKYICGYVDSSQSLVQILESYRTTTGTSYSNQNLSQSIKSMDETQLQSRFMSPAARPRLFWQMNAGEPTIQYDGVPFMTVGHGTDLPCMQYGGRKKRVNQLSLPSGEVVPMDCRLKTGCEAKITIRQIKRFPCAQYNETTVLGIAAVRRERKQILDELVQRVIAGTAKAQERYYVLLPTPMAHNGHALTEFDTTPPITQPLLEELVHNLGGGVTCVSQLRDRLKNFIYATYGTEPALHPCNPSEFEVFLRIYWLYKTGDVIDHDFKNSIKPAVGSGMGQGGVAQQQQQQVMSPAISHSQKNGLTDLSAIQASATISTSAAEAIKSVYSIIMEDTTAHHQHDGSTHHLGSPAPLGQIEDPTLNSEQEVDLGSRGSPTNVGVVMDEVSMVDQIQIRMGGNSGLSGNLVPSAQFPGRNDNGAAQQQLQHGRHSIKNDTPFGSVTPTSKSGLMKTSHGSSFAFTGNGEQVSSGFIKLLFMLSMKRYKGNCCTTQ